MTKYVVILKLIQELYEWILRPALVDYVKSTENDWDDKILGIIDAIIYAEYKLKKDM
jgi:hypothetical protein